MGTLGNLELPVRMSSCLRLFIETLFEEGNVRQSTSWLECNELQSELTRAIPQEEELVNEISH